MEQIQDKSVLLEQSLRIKIKTHLVFLQQRVAACLIISKVIVGDNPFHHIQPRHDIIIVRDKLLQLLIFPDLLLAIASHVFQVCPFVLDADHARLDRV